MGALWALIFICQADAQIRRADTRVVPLQQDDARQKWQNFKSSRTADCCMDFTIEHAPRRGESVEYAGTLFNLNDGATTLTRILVEKAGNGGGASAASRPAADILLINSPGGAQVWKFDGNKAVRLPKSEWLSPIMDGLIYSPFDLLVPYKSWEAKYAGPGRIGQAVHFFDLQAPEDFNLPGGEPDVKVGKVRVALTREFDTPAAAEVYSNFGRLLKTLTLASAKKIDGVWLAAKLELRDDITRSKDILRFTAAKMRAALPKGIFSPESLGKRPEKPLLEEF